MGLLLQGSTNRLLMGANVQFSAKNYLMESPKSTIKPPTELQLSLRLTPRIMCRSLFLLLLSFSAVVTTFTHAHPLSRQQSLLRKREQLPELRSVSMLTRDTRRQNSNQFANPKAARESGLMFASWEPTFPQVSTWMERKYPKWTSMPVTAGQVS